MDNNTIIKSKIPGYESWHAMKQRCRSKRREVRKYYLDNGIYFCEGLNKFDDFISKLGRKPTTSHSIDRVDGGKPYTCGRCGECIAKNTPNNVRWATPSQQMINRSTPVDNKSGYMGVKIRKEYTPHKYTVRIAVKREVHNIGTYDTFDEAMSARLMAESVYWG